MMPERPSLAVGLMSGTSLDGMDAALVRFDGPTRATLLAFVTRPYDAAERGRIEHAITGGRAPELARLHAQLGHWAVEAVTRLWYFVVVAWVLFYVVLYIVQ